ncbi:aldo/keto reductase [Flavobacterium sp. CYK-4]|uniref:aldo/keto reductase n=1 Tax=Flavobacterium lotistagni TaxID=2709660 RepID=UPI0014077B83|nr:aldo/keto reductase [Flavobacterium lotistagni]NHM06069.1 aldo/keto reductase [Flavobacterium lotistagni]
MEHTTFSKLIAGVMTWGSWGKNLNTSDMENLIQVCLENGLSSFDHADIYGGYSTESAFGTALKQSGIDRKKIQLITKCGIQYQCENRPNQIKHYDYSKDYIIWSVETSLKNLQTDYLDLLLLHRPSPLMHPEEIAEAIHRLKTEGKILDFGVSNFTASQTDLIQSAIKVNYNQIQFSATHLQPMLDGSLDYMQTQNIRPMAWNPLGSVFKRDDLQAQRVLSVVNKLAVKYETAPDLILLSWILKHPAGILPVCGTANPKRIKQLIKATEIDLELQDWFSIWVESTGNKVP